MAKSTTGRPEDVQDQIKEVTDEVAALAGMLKDIAVTAGGDLRGAASERP